jgi:FMN phosphatase YigB (HAD superfamily)
MLFIFDMDNVLYRYDWRYRMHGLTDITGWDFQELRRRWWHDEGEWLAEAGIPKTGDEYLARVNDALESAIDQKTWLTNRQSAMTVWPDMVDVARKASTLGHVTVLTNNGALIGEHLAEVAPDLPPVFGTHLYATAHFGARKPDPVVFSRVMDAFGATPEETFFIDDMPENIRGAETLGITGQWFGPHHTADDAWSAMTAFAETR